MTSAPALLTALRFGGYKVSEYNQGRISQTDPQPSTVVRSPIISSQGRQLALLVATVTASAVDAEVAVQGALNAKSEMASPNDYTDQLQPALAIGAAVTNQSGLLGVLDRLDGFMRLADLAAEVRCIVR